jgi:hypothetical protein
VSALLVALGGLPGSGPLVDALQPLGKQVELVLGAAFRSATG